MEMMRFEHIEYLYGLILIPFFILLFLMALRSKKMALKKFGDIALTSKLIKHKPKYSHFIRFSLIIFAFIFLVFVLANFQYGTKVANVKREGVDIVLAIDLSNSMMAEDVKPNRLERTKQFVYRMLEKLAGDRVGLIVFAGNAYMQSPITTDYSAIKLNISDVNTDGLPTQGTAIGDAIDLSMEMFDKKSKKYKTLIIISDGENHEGDATEKAKEAAEAGIIIHTVGVGTSKGSPVPKYRGKEQIDFQRDQDGNYVLSKLNEPMLQEIAAVGKGDYFKIANSSDNLKELIARINKQDKKEIDTVSVTDYESKFQYFLFIAILLLIIEYLITGRKSLLNLNFMK